MHRRGQLACKQGDYTLAEQCFSGVLESDHCRFTVWFDRGRVRVKQAEASESHEATKKWAEALDDFTCALELKKGDGATLACLAYCSSRKNNYATAVALYDRALDAKFPAARLLNNRARCLLLSPQHNDPMDVNGAARKNLDDALSQEPGLRAALCNRALLAMNQWLCNPETTISDMVFHDLKNAIELGALSGEFFELAAIASAASTSRASFKDWDALKRQTLDYLSLAVAYGKDRTRLATNPILAHLVSAEEFEALSNIKPTREKDVPLSRLLWVDPVDD